MDETFEYIRRVMEELGRDAAHSLRICMEAAMHNAETAHGVAWYIPDPTCPCAVNGTPSPICVSAGRTAYCTCSPGAVSVSYGNPYTSSDPHKYAAVAHLLSTWPCQCRSLAGTPMVFAPVPTSVGLHILGAPITNAPPPNATQPTRGVSFERVQELKRIGFNPRSRYFLERLKAEE